MINLIMILSLTFLAMVILFFERRIHQSWVTPTSIVFVPAIVVYDLYFLLGQMLGFVNIYPISMIYMVISLFIFMIVSFCSAALANKRVASAPSGSLSLKHNTNRVLNFVAIIVLLIVSARIIDGLSAAGFRVNALTSASFQGLIGSGIYLYLRVFLMCFIVVIISTRNLKNIFNIILLLWSFVAIAVSLVVGTVLLPVAAGIYAKLLLDGRFNLRIVGIAVFLGAVVFVGINFFNVVIVEKEQLFNLQRLVEMIQKMFYYLFSGILGLSEYVRINGFSSLNEVYTLLAPFLNIYNKVFNPSAEWIDPVTTYRVQILTSPAFVEMGSNVKTFFGTIFIFSDYLTGLLYIFCTASISYMMYYSRRSVFRVMGYAYLVSPLFFVWFEFYYWHSFLIIGFFYFFVLEIMDRFVFSERRRRDEKNSNLYKSL